MSEHRSLDHIEPYAAERIRIEARLLVGQAGLSFADVADIRHDMIADLLERLRHYDSGLSGRRTFICRVIRHKAARIREKRLASNRDVRVEAESVNEVLFDDDGLPTERGDELGEEDGLPSFRRSERTNLEARDLVLDVRRALEKLPLELQSLCRELLDATPTQIARNRGCKRTTLYYPLTKIRDAFREAGLADYLGDRR